MDRYSPTPSRAARGAEHKEAPAPKPQAPPAPAAPSITHPRNKKRSKKWLILAIIAAVVVVLSLWWFVFKGASAEIQGGKYQAVFLSNGQVYFGKMSFVGTGYIKLTNVFYIQSSSDVQDTKASSANTDMQLIKLGNEIHGPQDSMIINRDQVLFFENLKDDGKVVETIKQAQKE